MTAPTPDQRKRSQIGFPDPGSPVKVPGQLVSVTTSSEGLMAIIAVEGGRIVVPYWSVDLSPMEMQR